MEINLKHLKDAVNRGAVMREAQKNYFRNRSKENLVAAKTAEGYFDKALTWLQQLIKQEETKTDGNN